jgi:threonine dehydratase
VQVEDISGADVDAAAQRLAGVVALTPLERCVRLSDALGAEVYLKREDLQVVRSYKIRGAYNLMAQLTPAERDAGVVCASAGNHAQGFALACRLLEVHGRIYLPRNTQRQKRERILHHGGSWVRLIVGGATYDDAAEAAEADVARSGATMVPPFDDLRTIAGQGTIAAEIVGQLGRVPDLIVAPVGGGGLLAGLTTVARERYPDLQLVGVEPMRAASMSAAIAAGHPVVLDHMDPFVDGAAVRRAGTHTHAIIAAAKVPVVGIAEGRICTEILALYQNEGIIAEPAGALATASLTSSSWPADVVIEPGSTVVAVVSGGNNDISRYGEILERSLVHEGLKHYFLVNFPQEQGALRRFLDDVLGPEEDIVLFEYTKRNNRETGPALVGLELSSAADLDDLLRRMDESPLEIERLDPHSATFRYLT